MSSKPKSKKQKKRHKFLQKMKENWVEKRKVEKREAELARREWNKKREEAIRKERNETGSELDGADRVIMDMFYVLKEE